MEDQPVVLPPAPSKDTVLTLLKEYPLPVDPNSDDKKKPLRYSYGTAGFRYNASLLESVMVRTGLLAAYRSAQLGESVGVMITASHNDESYNGVKLADPHGGMMTMDGEQLAVRIANEPLPETVYETLSSLKNDNKERPTTAVVHVGRDTRSHSPALSELTIRAARAMGAQVLSHGVVTTPILHYCVMHHNTRHLPPLIPPRPNVLGYYQQVSNAYMALLRTHTNDDVDVSSTPLVVDCACGVGYAHVERMYETLRSMRAQRLLLPRNGPGEGPLNEGCGSEHVQKGICPPKWYSGPPESLLYAASLDGDSDRIVFFSQKTPEDFSLLDGDKIAVLICDFLKAQVVALQQAAVAASASLPQLKLGVVQTAYANGASTDYLRSVLGEDNVLIAKTGVKHVHPAAHDNFDVGVYFEANGHGTVLFGDAFYAFLASADAVLRGNLALQRLQLLPALINQSVGDAICDLLLVDAILQIQQRDIVEWDNLYQDLPSRQCKVKVQDRTMIKTNDNETRCTSPVELQEELDKAMEAMGNGARCFVRPSGTENVVRVYAEAATTAQANALATQAASLVHTLCAGIATPPSFP